MDYSKYHPDWKDVIRPAILKRDNYKCAQCGIVHKSEVYRTQSGAYIIVDDFTKQWALSQGKKVFTLFLQVAHLDHDKSNNSFDNLLSLCPRCHQHHDKEFKKIARTIKQEIYSHNQKSAIPDAIEARRALITDVRVLVKKLTNVSIENHDAESIILTVLNTSHYDN